MLKSKKYTKMRWSIALLYAFVAYLICFNAEAKNGPHSPSTPAKKEVGADVVPMELDGEDGIWMPRGPALNLLKALNDQTVLIDSLQHRLDLEKGYTSLLEKDKKDLGLIAASWEEVARKQAAALAAGKPWWEKPWFLSSVGFVGGTAITLAILFAVSPGS